MKFTITTLAQSLADYLAPDFPGVTFYEDPNQQGTAAPCLFLQQRYSRIYKRLDGRYLRHIGLDLVYLVDYNLPDMQRRYQAAAEALDERMELFPYSDGTETGLIRTYERNWRIDLDAMHYMFELQAFVRPEGPEAGKMQDMDLILIVEEAT